MGNAPRDLFCISKVLAHRDFFFNRKKSNNCPNFAIFHLKKISYTQQLDYEKSLNSIL